MFAVAYTVRGAGNNPEPFGVAFHHLGPTFIYAYIVNSLQTWLIENEGNMGVMSYLGQGGHALSECFVWKRREVNILQTSLV